MKFRVANLLPKIFLVFVLLLALIPSLFLAGKDWLEKRMQRPFALGEYTVLPTEFHFDTPLSASFRNILIIGPGEKLSITNPQIRLSPFGGVREGETFLQLEFPDVVFRQKSRTKIHLPSTQATSDSTLRLTFPELQLPFPASLKIGRLRLESDSSTWLLRSTKVSNPDDRSLKIESSPAWGPGLPQPMHLKIVLDWRDSGEVATELSLLGTHDSLELEFRADKKNLLRFGADIRLKAKTPFAYAKTWLDSTTPKVENLEFTGNFSNEGDSPDSLQYDFEASLLFDPENFPGKQNLKIQAAGKGRQPSFKIEGHGAEKMNRGEHFLFQGMVQGEKELDFKGFIRGLAVPAGKNTVITDAEIVQAKVQGDSLFCQLITGDGSRIDGIALLKAPWTSSFKMEVSPKERWMTTWTKDKLDLRHGTIFGTWNGEALTAKLKGSTSFAWYAAADTLETNFRLDGKGIVFDSSSLWHRNQRYGFTGEVIWQSDKPHYKFDLLAGDSGRASVFGDFIGGISLNISGLDIEALPLADTSLTKGISGSITGNWNHRFPQKSGQALLLFSTKVGESPLDMTLQARQLGDSLFVDALNIRHGENFLTARAAFLAGNFPDSSLSIGGIRLENFSAKTDGLQLAPFASTFLDSSFRTGKLTGSLHYKRASGLSGRIGLRDLSFTNVDKKLLHIPRIHLDAVNDKIQLTARVKLGRIGEWDSELAINADHIFSARRNFSAALVMDQGGILWSETSLSGSETLQGDLKVKGPWILPEGGELESSRLLGNFSWKLHEGFDGLKISVRGDSTLWHMASVRIPVEFRASLEKGKLTVPSLEAFNKKGHRLSSSLSMDLNSGELEDFRFYSHRFDIPFGEKDVLVLHKPNGSMKKDSNGLHLILNVPATETSFTGEGGKSIEGGGSNLKLEYTIPSQTKNFLKTSNHKLAGSVFLNKLIYRQNFEDVSRIGKSFMGGLFAKKKKGGGKKEDKVQKHPIDLDIRIFDAGKDSLWIRTDVLEIPFTTELHLTGHTAKPLLKGDFSSVRMGSVQFIEVPFDLKNLRITWDESPPAAGILNTSMSRKMGYCIPSDDRSFDESCEVQFSVSGSLDKPEVIPNASCRTEMDASAIFSSLILDCIPEGEGESDYGQLGRAAISKGIKLVAHKAFNQMLGWNAFDVQAADFNLAGDDREDKDSVLVAIRPLKSSAFQLLGGYTSFAPGARDYDQSIMFGLALPVYQADTNLTWEEQAKKNMLIQNRVSLESKAIWKNTQLIGVDAKNLESSELNSWELDIASGWQWKFWHLPFLTREEGKK